MKNEIEKIGQEDARFPDGLRAMKSGPKVLYFRGKLPQPDEKMAAIVGSRVCSDYGRRAASEIAQGLAEAGFSIVSGLAPGIDTIGHETALEHGGRTIAVLGTGLNRENLYPQANLDLSEEIVNNGGCLLSEYPAGTRGARFTFPQRNRIVAGLSMAVVVIEAKIRSGSLGTVLWAKKLGKPVFAVPGSIYSVNSGGCNELIRQGATLVRNAQDILAGVGQVTEIRQKTIHFGENPDEISILEVLGGEALETDKIIAATGLAAATVLSVLAVLEIKGRIKSIGGMKYYRNH